MGFDKEEVKIDEEDYKRFKEIEKKTKHDVKAIEYLLRERVKNKWAVHLFLTSDDVNNLGYGLMLKEYKDKVFPRYKGLVEKLLKFKGGVIAGYTHGKVAVPSLFSRFVVFHAYRISEIYREIREFKIKGKISGAVGDLNSFSLYKKDYLFWKERIKGFVESLGLEYEEFTTQIMRGEHYSKFFFKIMIINNIMRDLAEDLWLLSFKGYLKLRVSRIGSSTMPHKVNPIELENAIGNIKLSNKILSLFTEDLIVSKLHRDISDSTIKRNSGVGLAHSLLAMKNLVSFVEKMEFNESKAKEDLKGEVFSEQIQTILRLKKKEDAYEITKKAADSGSMDSLSNEIVDKEYIGFSNEIEKEMRKKIEENLKN